MNLKTIRDLNKNSYRILLPILIAFFLLPVQLNAQEGRELFQTNCAVCHQLGKGKLVGPDLAGVTERRDRDWLLRFIENSQEVIKSGDPIAVELAKEYNNSIMPSFTQLSDAEVNSIIDYIGNWQPEEVKIVSVDVNKKTGFAHEEYLRGQRMFFGLIELENGRKFNCTNCHNTVTSDTLNWNPSAIDLANSFIDPKGMNIYQSMAQPVSNLMAKAHDGISMTEQEVYYISAYLSHLSGEQLEVHRSFPIKLLLFILFAMLMTLSIIDLMFTHIVKYKIIHIVILLAGISVHSYLAVIEAINLSRTEDYAPDQPIKFSHKIHAGNNKTDCRYCHHEVEISKSAGIPSANVCMACHNVVKTGTNSGNFEINKILRAVNTEKPISWVRVHNLPDHAFFNHSQHVSVGNVNCETCHGKVQEMHILKQVSDLSMGWCVNCHRDTKINLDNKYYSIYKRANNNLNQGNLHPNVDDLGGIDCMKCHY